MLHIEGGMFTYQNKTLDGTHLTKVGVCQPMSEYVWGFSFLLLLPFTIITVPLTLAILLIWYVYEDRLWPQQVDMIFGRLRTSLAVSASIRDTLGEVASDMTNDELQRLLEEGKLGVKRSHAGAMIMSKPGPFRRAKKVVKGGDNFPVGSERYQTFMRDGYARHKDEPRSSEKVHLAP